MTSSVSRPAASASRTTVTRTRVPLTQGWPWQINGSIEISSSGVFVHLPIITDDGPVGRLAWQIAAGRGKAYLAEGNAKHCASVAAP
jgi:hypothetical protein